MGLYRPTVTRKRKDGTRTREKSPLWWGKFQHPTTRKWLYVALKNRRLEGIAAGKRRDSPPSGAGDRAGAQGL